MFALYAINVVCLAGTILLLLAVLMGHEDERGEIKRLVEVVAALVKETRELRQDIRKILQILKPQLVLTTIKIQFGGIMPLGPVTLNVGQSVTASVLGFDQNGNPMPSTFVMPPVSFTIDNSAIASSTPNADNATDQVTGVAPGVANLTANLTSAEGLALSDTETVTVPAVPPPTPVLSSIKISFDQLSSAKK